MDKILTKIGISFGTSLVVNEAVNLEPLWTALITLAVSLLTIFTVEGGAWLKAFLKAKKAKRELEEKEYEKESENKKED